MVLKPGIGKWMGALAIAPLAPLLTDSNTEIARAA